LYGYQIAVKVTKKRESAESGAKKDNKTDRFCDIKKENATFASR
jgi:hypothetical protein